MGSFAKAAAGGLGPSQAGPADFDGFFRTTIPKAFAVVQRLTADHNAAEDSLLEAMAKAHVRWCGAQPGQEVQCRSATCPAPAPECAHSVFPFPLARRGLLVS